MVRDSKGRFIKGPGRKPGTKNKLPRALAAKVIHVCEELEKEGKSLLDEARKDPRWFYAIFIRTLLPKGIMLGYADEEKPLRFKLEIFREVPIDFGNMKKNDD
jgi:hypothetical protein